MVQTVKERFNNDYKYVRLQLLKGMISLKDAKRWLQERGIKTADAMQEALNAADEKHWRERADRLNPRWKKDTESDDE